MPILSKRNQVSRSFVDAAKSGPTYPTNFLLPRRLAGCYVAKDVEV